MMVLSPTAMRPEMVIGSGATVGGLVGQNNNSGIGDVKAITNSYWLDSSASSGGSGFPAGTSRTALQLASPTTTAITYTNWAPDVWDFGRSFEYPALKYAGDTCETTPVKSDTGPPICGTLLAGDQPVSIVRLLPRCTAFLIDIYPDDGDNVPQFMDVDKDNDGLIEICDLEGLNEMRHQLDGTGYNATDGGTAITAGCLGGGDCTGYELTKDLDFMDDASYRDTANKATYTVSDYDASDDNGWDSIGKPVRFISSVRIPAAPFNAMFDGNGYTISNLMINRPTGNSVSLFGATASNAKIANLGLLDVNVQGRSSVAGLVSFNGGTITNSYATGLVTGTSRSVGGLVGSNSDTIRNSYATVSVSGPLSNIGGLVGSHSGMITNSYATGIVTGTGTGISAGNIGGLVGVNNNGTITNSYARGEVRAAVATIGGLFGRNTGTITRSYWLSGSASSRDVDANTEKTMMELQEPTTATDIYENWNTVDTVAWDFGTSRQYPILKYADDNLMGSLIVTGDLIPNQGIGLRSLQTSTTGAELIPTFGEATTRHAIAVPPPGTSDIDLTLAAYNPTAMIEVVTEGDDNDYFAGKGSGDSVPVPIATTPVLTITVTEADLEEVVYQVVVTTLPPCTVSLDTPDDNDGVEQALDIDKDGDGLIEICDLEGLDAMRYQLDGMGYRTTAGATVITTGCPSTGCTGYELANSLDFMAASSYRSSRSRNTAWTMGAGWQPIGTSSEVFFSARFEGNGHTISNLMIDRSGENNIGLFGRATNEIANLGLRNVDISGQNRVGGLVGSNSTTITNSYVTGSVLGNRFVGGLVGDNQSAGFIRNSYATASVEGTGANVGGLVGRNSATIMNSYAIGSVEGSGANVGGLVGNNQSTGSIRNSYATGRVIGSGATVGGLVGGNAGTITGGYWLSRPGINRGRGDTTSTPTTAIALISPTAPTTTTYAGWDTNVWDFGTNEQYPSLRYATECDPGEPSDKSDTGQPICGEPLLNQQVELQSQLLPSCTNALALIGDYRTDNDRVPQRLDVDKDDNGLIEICDLEGLFEMRYALDGSGYRTAADAMSITTGCRTTPTTDCTGFELTRDLDFNDPNSYRSRSINPAWTDTSGAGWDPIGVSTSTFNAFSATFDGNGYTIANLLINRSTDTGVGFFRGITGRIDDIRLANVRVTGATNTAGLAGVSLGTINNAYVSGTISGTGDNVGGLVGYNSEGDGITNSYTLVTVSGNDSIGGLVGYNQAPIINSYAIADVSGNDSVGGLVGENEASFAMIRNSFALATVRGNSSVGGLVGFLDGGRIFNGYARGLVSASMTDVGGLVGVIANAGQVNNSYAVVEVVGGATVTNIGGLVGRSANTGIVDNDSYWDSRTSGRSTSDGGMGKTTMELQEPTTATGIYEDWSTAAWDFGSTGQYPRLRYGKGADENNPACFEDDSNSDEGLPKCGDLLSGQDNFLPQCTISLNTTDDNDGVPRVIDIDKDDDGLIEICDLEGLDEMRYQLDGMGYKTTDSETVVPITTGCSSTCTGFELTSSLDFMDDNSYRNTVNKVTWTVANYDDRSDTGWQPIGGSALESAFNATLEGNGYTIANLMINRNINFIGLFGSIGSAATIANLGLLDVNIMGRSTLGSLVGQSYAGTVINSYATGRVTSSAGTVGGLVGWNDNRATIRNSYAAVSISASRSGVSMGGLAGQNGGTIENSYATGSVSGNNLIGGLVGNNEKDGSIANSYAIGRVTGTGNNIGGLVGNNEEDGTITGSYWLSRPDISSGTGDTTSTPQTVTMLTSPTMPGTISTDVYYNWNSDADIWDFGTANQYPALKYATECVEPPDTDTNPVKLQTGQPICGTLLSDDQPVDASIRLRVKVFLEGPLQ